MYIIKFTSSGGEDLAHDRKPLHSQSRVTAASATACLACLGILNNLPGLTSFRCNNIGLVSLIPLGWELRLISLYYAYKASRPCLS